MLRSLTLPVLCQRSRHFPENAIAMGSKAAGSSIVSRKRSPPHNICGVATGSMSCLCGDNTGASMTPNKLDLLQGTLDVMVLQTLATLGPLHGYGIARRIEQVSGNQVLLNQGTIYASLVRLQHRGLISAKWGTSENNRKAKFYSITKRGSKRLADDAEYWRRLADVMGRVFASSTEDSNS